MSARSMALKVHGVIEPYIYMRIGTAQWRAWITLWLFVWASVNIGRCAVKLETNHSVSARPNSLALPPERPWSNEPTTGDNSPSSTCPANAPFSARDF